ncbi:MAG TPA: hypothetical protein PKM59_00330 [Thermodesulfobacteriota bacterium]|nr:hypothetical protein [Thermodesulfobacteriota bacterium]HNU70185.1 hypothetical protein [Thermodesulfobacteriota bacterium]
MDDFFPVSSYTSKWMVGRHGSSCRQTSIVTGEVPLNNSMLHHFNFNSFQTRTWLTIFIAGFAFLALEAAHTLLFPYAGFAQDDLVSSVPLSIRVNEGKISVAVRDASLVDILQEISRQTGIKVVYKTPPTEKVTCRFKNLPLEKGIKKLLDGRNFLFSYTKHEEAVGGRSYYTINQLHLMEPGTNTQGATASRRTATPISRSPRVITPAVPPPPPPPPPVVPQTSPVPPGVAPEAANAPPIAPEEMLQPNFPPELIAELLKQDPAMQAEAQKIINETMKDAPEQANQQLMELLERYVQQEGEKGSEIPESIEHIMEQLSRETGEAPNAEAPSSE